MTSRHFVPLPDAAVPVRARKLVSRIMMMNAKAHWEEIRSARRQKRPGKWERAANALRRRDGKTGRRA